MIRLIVTLFVFAVLACGGSDTVDTGAAGGAAPGDESASAPAPKTPEPVVAPEPSAPPDPMVRNCLDLIRRGKYQPALTVCLAALDIDPDNQQVQDAVAKAREETAKLAAAEAAGEAVGEGAAEEASSKLGEATGGMTDKLPR